MTKSCPSCGSQNRDVARFCQNCQTPLDFNCPNCGTTNTGKARFCLNCGTALQHPSSALAGGSQPLGANVPVSTPPAAPNNQPFSGPGWPNLASSMLAPGTMLDAGHYRIDRTLGGGGMGKVYLAYDLRLAKYWAIKEMTDAALTDPTERAQAIQNFKNEAQMLANLDHYNLPKVTNHFQENGKYYLVMDYIDGETFEAMLEHKLQTSSDSFPEYQVIKWAEELCNVLGYLHSQNPPIIFRDLKPGNIMVEKNGRLRLIDFGVARLFKAGKSKDTASFGTQGFAPPEQYGKGQTDARSDVYALGATLHFLLTLRDPCNEPFKFPAVSTLNRKASKAVSDAVARAVNFERDDRWPSMSEFLRALKSTASQASAAAQAPATQAPKFAPINAAASASANAAAQPTPSPAYQPVPPAPVYKPPASSIASGSTSNTAKVRRSGFWGFLAWVAISTVLLFLLEQAATGTFTGTDEFSSGLFLGALLSFPQMLAVLSTRWPVAFSLPLMIVFLTKGEPDLVEAAFIGMLAGEIIFLFQSFNPKSFWRLFFAATIAYWLLFMVLSNGMYGTNFYLGLTAGTAVAAGAGRILSKTFHWDS